MSLNVTVLGLGAMGLPMATHLSSTFPVTAFDPMEARAALGRDAGIDVKATAREAADGADVVLVAVRNHAQLDAVLNGDDGVASVMKPGSVILLTSTVGIAAVEQVGAELTEAGLGLVDAPVSGGPVRAGNGDLLVVVGAYDDALSTAKPVLDEMASTLVVVGDAPGKGQAMKTVNQLLCGVHIAAAGEALGLASKLGLDPAQALDALMAGAAASFMLGDRGPRMLQAYDAEKPEVRSRLDIFVKDMGIVTDAARGAGMAVPLAAAAEQEYLMGTAAGQAAEDDSSVIRVVAPKKGL